MTQPIKVLCSYRSVDRSEVNAFVDKLHAAGIDAWFERYEIAAGDHTVEFERRAVLECQVALIFFSSRERQFDAWADATSLLIYNRLHAGLRVLPIRLDVGADIPALWKTLEWVDVDDLERVLRAIRDVRRAPQDETRFDRPAPAAMPEAEAAKLDVPSRSPSARPPRRSSRLSRGLLGSMVDALGSLFRRTEVQAPPTRPTTASAPRDDDTKLGLPVQVARREDETQFEFSPPSPPPATHRPASASAPVMPSARPQATAAPSAPLPSPSAVSPAPASQRDSVRFSVFAPRRVAPNASFLLDAWAYVSAQRGEMLSRAARRGAAIEVGERGPLALERGAELDLTVSIPAFGYHSPTESLTWLGETSNASFEVLVPAHAAPGSVLGVLEIRYSGLSLARLRFEFEVGATNLAAAELETREDRVRSVFASYSSNDRDEALRVKLHLEPLGIDVFVDVLSLRAGSDWASRLEREISARDRFYLLWSEAARRSEWVEREWRYALTRRGLDFIDPIALADPRDVPPPGELASLHFTSSARIALDYERSRRT